MASDSPATTIASHSPKKGGFQAAGRRSPGSSLPSKISTEACRSRWKAFLWRNGGEGSRRRSGKAGEGEGTGPRYDAVWPVMLRQKGGRRTIPLGRPAADRTGKELAAAASWPGRTAACALPWRDGAALYSCRTRKETSCTAALKTKTSHSHAGDVLANSGARDGT